MVQAEPMLGEDGTSAGNLGRRCEPILPGGFFGRFFVGYVFFPPGVSGFWV